MTVKNIYRSFYVLLGIVGIFIQLGVFNGNLYFSSLNYYTILSNILCVVYFSLRLVYDNRPAVDSKFRNFIESPVTKYCVTMCITLTFLVYHFLLHNSWAGDGGGINLFHIGNYIVHYIIPLMTIIDFLVFDRRNSELRWYVPFVWMVVPLVYFIYILLRAPLFGNIGTTSSPYPYPFIDFTIQPVSGVMLNIAGIIVVFIVIGYILLGINYLINKRVTTNK